MQKLKTIKRLKLIVVLVIAGTTFWAHFQTNANTQEESTRLFEIVGAMVPFEQRVGVDDRPSFVVHFEGDTHGTLEACG
jgi:hypothetical protein